MPRKVRIIHNFLGLCSFFSFFIAFSQEKPAKTYFLEGEYLFGKIIPNEPGNFPKNGPQQIIAFHYGMLQHDTTSWGRFYNFPEIGVTALYGNAGNNRVFGHQFSVLPFITFSVFNKAKTPHQLRVGLGTSYFSERFNKIENPTNNVISSRFSWDFRVTLYRTILQKNKFALKLGVGIAHQSNSHTKIPNKGMNSYFIGISGQFFNSENKPKPMRISNQQFAGKQPIVHFRQGFGFHEQSQEEGPKTDVVKPVYTTAVGIGFIKNEHIKWNIGVSGRFYQHYYDHLNENEIEGLDGNKSLESSNLMVFGGVELLMNHVGIDGDLEVNLFKPFFNEFNPSRNIISTLRQILSTRTGLNLYLFDANKFTGTNFYTGVHVNTNLGRADFMEINVGVVKKL